MTDENMLVMEVARLRKELDALVINLGLKNQAINSFAAMETALAAKQELLRTKNEVESARFRANTLSDLVTESHEALENFDPDPAIGAAEELPERILRVVGKLDADLGATQHEVDDIQRSLDIAEERIGELEAERDEALTRVRKMLGEDTNAQHVVNRLARELPDHGWSVHRVVGPDGRSWSVSIYTNHGMVWESGSLDLESAIESAITRAQFWNNETGGRVDNGK